MSSSIYDHIGKASIKHHKSICKLIDHLTRFCGIDRFWRNAHHKDGSYSVLGNAPSVAEAFFGQNLFLGHPYFRDPIYFQTGFSLPDLFNIQEYEETQGKLRNKGDCHHVLIHIHKLDEGFIEYGFARSEFHPGFESFYLNHLPTILKFIDYFEKEASRVIYEADNARVNMAKIIGAKYHENPRLPCALIVPEKELAFVSAVTRELSYELLSLTKSEKAILRQYLKGHTTQEIAKTTFRSPRTIETHLERAKAKLGVRTRSGLFDILLPLSEYL